MASPLHCGKPEQWGVTPIDIVVTAKNKGPKRSTNTFCCWSRTNLWLDHAMKMQLIIVEFVIFSTVQRSRAFLQFSGKNNGLSYDYSIGGSDIPFLSAWAPQYIVHFLWRIMIDIYVHLSTALWVNSAECSITDLNKLEDLCSTSTIPSLLRLAPKCIEFLIWLIVWGDLPMYSETATPAVNTLNS